MAHSGDGKSSNMKGSSAKGVDRDEMPRTRARTYLALPCPQRATAQPRFRSNAGPHVEDRSEFRDVSAFGARRNSGAISSTTDDEKAERREGFDVWDKAERNLGSGFPPQYYAMAMGKEHRDPPRHRRNTGCTLRVHRFAQR